MLSAAANFLIVQVCKVQNCMQSCFVLQVRGLTPRIFQHLFDTIADHSSTSGVKVSLLLAMQSSACPAASATAPCSELCLLLSVRLRAMCGPQGGESVRYLCKCSFLEIYNETITDLLSLSDSNLHIREDIRQGIYVEGLLQEEVSNGETYTLCRAWRP